MFNKQNNQIEWIQSQKKRDIFSFSFAISIHLILILISTTGIDNYNPGEIADNVSILKFSITQMNADDLETGKEKSNANQSLDFNDSTLTTLNPEKTFEGTKEKSFLNSNGSGNIKAQTNGLDLEKKSPAVAKEIIGFEPAKIIEEHLPIDHDTLSGFLTSANIIISIDVDSSGTATKVDVKDFNGKNLPSDFIKIIVNSFLYAKYKPAFLDGKPTNQTMSIQIDISPKDDGTIISEKVK